jgi:hypothetical protein
MDELDSELERLLEIVAPKNGGGSQIDAVRCPPVLCRQSLLDPLTLQVSSIAGHASIVRFLEGSSGQERRVPVFFGQPVRRLGVQDVHQAKAREVAAR